YSRTLVTRDPTFQPVSLAVLWVIVISSPRSGRESRPAEMRSAEMVRPMSSSYATRPNADPVLNPPSTLSPFVTKMIPPPKRASARPVALPVRARCSGGSEVGVVAATGPVVIPDWAVVDGATVVALDGAVVVATVVAVDGGGAAFTTMTPCIAAYPWIAQ